MLTHSAVARKARLALILRARRPVKPAKFDGDADGFRTGASGKDNVPYTPAAKKLAAKAAKAAAPKTTTPRKRTAAKSPQDRAREAWEHGQQAILRIEQWRDDNGQGDPFDDLPGDEPWTTARLKAAAEALGVTPEGRATGPRLKAALVRYVADRDLPRTRRPTRVDIGGQKRRLDDLSAAVAATAAREGRVDARKAAAHLRRQADEADQAAAILRRPDTSEPDRPTGRQKSIPFTQRDREAAAARREAEAQRLRDRADRIAALAPKPPPRERRRPPGLSDEDWDAFRQWLRDNPGKSVTAWRRATAPQADPDAVARYRQRLRGMDDQGVEATLQLLDAGSVTFANPADEAAVRRAVLAEMRRRNRTAQRATEQAQRYEQIRAEQPEVDELTAWALATGQDPERLAAKMERLASPSVRQLRRDWQMLVETELQEAEEATNGQMVKPEGRLRYDRARRARVSVDPRDFWRRPAAYVDRWASEEFQEWAARRGGITTFAAYRAMVEGGGTLRDIRARDRGRYGEAA